jgi:hypothetical protein
MTRHTWTITNIVLRNQEGMVVGEVKFDPDHGWYWGVGRPLITKEGVQVPHWKVSSIWRPDPGPHYLKTQDEAQTEALAAAEAEGLL